MAYINLGTRRRGFNIETATEPKEVIALLGEPSSSWDDDVEHCLEYELPEIKLRFYWEVTYARERPGLRFERSGLAFKNVDIGFKAFEPEFIRGSS